MPDPLPINNTTVTDHAQVEAECTLCGRTFLLDEAHEISVSFCFCVDCTNMLEGFDLNFRPPDHYRQDRDGQVPHRRNADGDSELLMQHSSQLINSTMHNWDTIPLSVSERELYGDSLSTVTPLSTYATPNRSERWRWLSDDENVNSACNLECSLFCESDSNWSIGLYGTLPGDSDALSFSAHGPGSDLSVRPRSLSDQEIHLPDGWYDSDNDTDIDPMRAGQSLEYWSAYYHGEGSSLETTDTDCDFRTISRVHPSNMSDDNSSNHQAENASRSYTYLPSLLTAYSEPNLWNSGDLLDMRDFDELLEQLAEPDYPRGAPRASPAYVQNLPRVLIDADKNGCILCAICKDPLTGDSEANQLPCSHLYHPTCIVPWLSTRNSCPVCRYELPTDDKDYGEQQHSIEATNSVTNQHSVSSRSLLDETEVVEMYVLNDCEIIRAEGTWAQRSPHAVNHDSQSSREVRSVHRWIMAAAPIVGILGVALALWFGNCSTGKRVCSRFGKQTQKLVQEPGVPYIGRSNRAQKWRWFFFSRFNMRPCDPELAN